MTDKIQHSSSFRDPSGYVFTEGNILKRQISLLYFKQYKALKESGFYQKLIKAGLLIPHKEITEDNTGIVIQPEFIPFVTYPYEWSFNQYKEAALLTLKLQKFCLDHDFSLKDATAFNVTFHKGKAIFIDTLSFDFYQDNSPWRAYKQFISHFFGPLLLAHYHGAQSLKLMHSFIDGIPVKLISSMLPGKTKLSPFLYSNIHLLSKYEDKHSEDYKGEVKHGTLSKGAQQKIIKSLYEYIKRLKLKEASEWGDYYDKTNYTSDAFLQKEKIVNAWVKETEAKTLIDVGGNDGTFVRKIDTELKQALVCDIDNNAVDINYREVKGRKEIYMTPFVQDVLNPSASIGFNNDERFSFKERLQKFSPDITLALAVIHHISLSGNVPFKKSAEFFAAFSNYLIIELPKREDSWVQRLLNAKSEFKGHFDFYNQDNFETEFMNYFSLEKKEVIANSHRIMYLLKSKNAK
ncbi:class I SAM-dependent methyltransferase [Mangrovimonas sp. YM274]|uniref:class I SAM-dependent methyltransferase n=1 Tax=Mangrovimonas sp. YM274 TaxID=3070660 RepID=UPI0027DAE18F|nr:class I SAM-dependent methyltransferase [Mangrovimonas sp. YM274]WMI68046.1 class I SAM-dependent methyltransferase [Mangrovimonas sp. YM274]